MGANLKTWRGYFLASSVGESLNKEFSNRMLRKNPGVNKKDIVDKFRD